MFSAASKMAQTAHYARADLDVKRDALERIGRAVR